MFWYFYNCETTRKTLTLLFTEWLSSPVGTKFSKRIEDMSKEELNECLKCFYTSAKKKDGTYYKNTSMKSIRADIDRFLRSPPHNKPFSIISDAVFTGDNKVLDAFVKDLRRTGKVAGIVHKKAVSKDQIQRLFESGELGPADSQNPAQLQRTAWFYLTLFFGRRGRRKPAAVDPWNAVLKKNATRCRAFWVKKDDRLVHCPAQKIIKAERTDVTNWEVKAWLAKGQVQGAGIKENVLWFLSRVQ